MSHRKCLHLAWFVERAGHPLFLASALGLWWGMGKGVGAIMASLVLSLLLMEILERLVPAVPRWHQNGGEKLRLAIVYIVVLILLGTVVLAYENLLFPAFAGFRDGFGSEIWPANWPIVFELLILYFASDFIYYWIHRAIHSSSILWRISGHGFHHAFHNLHAINVNATHPFEILFLAVPMVLLAAIFGASGEAVVGATVLLAVNATLAHANIRMETPVFNWFFTSSNQHRRHHSVVFEESNTNYACNAIVWDRLFGTYSCGEVQQTGIGPRQPGLWKLVMLPFREPGDADTVSSRSAVLSKE